jgi:hypothetical protein
MILSDFGDVAERAPRRYLAAASGSIPLFLIASAARGGKKFDRSFGPLICCGDAAKRCLTPPRL